MIQTQAARMALEKGMHAPVPFTKMQALGNDFVFIDEAQLSGMPSGGAIVAELDSAGGKLAARLCDRRFGIGADGMIVVRKSNCADCSIGWMYFNSDGSTSSMCGNGLRCLAQYCISNGLVSQHKFSVETAVGPVEVELLENGDFVSDLGHPQLASDEIPVAGDRREKVLKEQVVAGGRSFQATCVGMGNPHCVIFDGGVSAADLPVLSAQIQQLPFFPKGVNVEFVDVISPREVSVYVYERGSGPTLACASGAAAVVVAGVLEGRLERSADVNMPGGRLKVEWSDGNGRVRLIGPAQMAYRGVFDLDAYWPEAKK